MASDALDTPSLAKRPRVSRVDYAKAVAVLLVVVGHVLGGLDASGIREDGLSQALHGLHQRNSFRMPALFLIAGIFAERALRRGFGTFVREKASYLLFPYIVWNLVNYGVLASAHAAERATGQNLVNTPLMWPHEFAEMLLYKVRDLWFLYALFATLVVYAALRVAGMRMRWIFAISIVLHVIARLGFFDVIPMAFQVGRLLFFLTLGAMFADSILSIGHRAKWWQPLLCALGFGTVMILIGSSEIMSIKPRVDALERTILDADNLRLLLAQMPVRLSVSLTGISALVSFAVLFERLGGPRFLEYLGKVSMEVYIVSGFGMVASRIILHNRLGVDQAWILIIAGISAGIALPLAVIWFSNLVGFKYLFRFGKVSPTYSSAFPRA